MGNPPCATGGASGSPGPLASARASALRTIEIGRRRLGRLDHERGLAGGGSELAFIRTEEAHLSVAVVAGAVLGHGAFVEHG